MTARDAMQATPARASTDPVKVLYILGWGRSGTTLMSRILGHVDGIFNTGELQLIWGAGFIGNHRCGDRLRFHDSPTWQGIVRAAYGDASGVDAQEMLNSAREMRSVRTPIFFTPWRDAYFDRWLARYGERLTALYRAVASESGASLVVDASKHPLYAYALSRLGGIDLSILHMVRDPRATAFSWLRPKLNPIQSGSQMDTHSPLKNTVLWDAWNGIGHVLERQRPERYHFVRYEDFVARPRECVRAVLDFAGMPDAEAPFVSEHEIELGLQPSISGNTDRFKDGTIAIRGDERWREGLPRGARLLVSSLSWPLRRRYGYD